MPVEGGQAIVSCKVIRTAALSATLQNHPNTKIIPCPLIGVLSGERIGVQEIDVEHSGELTLKSDSVPVKCPVNIAPRLGKTKTDEWKEVVIHKVRGIYIDGHCVVGFIGIVLQSNLEISLTKEKEFSSQELIIQELRVECVSVVAQEDTLIAGWIERNNQGVLNNKVRISRWHVADPQSD